MLKLVQAVEVEEVESHNVWLLCTYWKAFIIKSKPNKSYHSYNVAGSFWIQIISLTINSSVQHSHNYNSSDN